MMGDYYITIIGTVITEASAPCFGTEDKSFFFVWIRQFILNQAVVSTVFLKGNTSALKNVLKVSGSRALK